MPESQVRSLATDALKDVPDKIALAVAQAIAKDTDLQKVLDLIQNGWSESKQLVPPEATPYFNIRDTLSHQDGVILKGKRIVIPREMRKEMKRKLHAAHTGDKSPYRFVINEKKSWSSELSRLYCLFATFCIIISID